ncbi:MAG: hypothetical protein ACJ744_17200 [Gaiellaceae bacterium]|jgi:hypothetical protein
MLPRWKLVANCRRPIVALAKKKREPELDDIRPDLWNDDVTPATYTAANEKYQAAILDQYKLYVEMADRISARRGLTNTFFLTLNSAVFTLFGVFWKDRPTEISSWALVLLAAVAVGQTAAWWVIVRSYRQLNTAKYKVVGLLEERLPASPYWSAEWTALAKGRDPSVYLPLTHVEQWVPVLFAVVYLLGFLLALTS